MGWVGSAAYFWHQLLLQCHKGFLLSPLTDLALIWSR